MKWKIPIFTFVSLEIISSNIGLNSEKLPQLTCMIVNELREDP